MHLAVIAGIAIAVIIGGIVAVSAINAPTKNPDYPYRPFTFAAVGDWGCDYPESRATLAHIKLKNPDLVLVAGDLSYTITKTDCWVENMQYLNGIERIAIGNHEHETEILYQAYMKHYNLTNPYYSFDMENVHFLMLHTEREGCKSVHTNEGCLPFTTEQPQYLFAKADLEQAASNSSIDWIVVAFHRPIYTSPNNTHGDYEYFRHIYHPLFDKYGVDLVIQAHIHAYERSHPMLFNATNYSYPSLNETGATFVTVGTGGAQLANFNGTKPFIAYQNDQEHGFVLFEVTPQNITGRFYPNALEAIDTFVVD